MLSRSRMQRRIASMQRKSSAFNALTEEQKMAVNMVLKPIGKMGGFGVISSSVGREIRNLINDLQKYEEYNNNQLSDVKLALNNPNLEGLDDITTDGETFLKTANRIKKLLQLIRINIEEIQEEQEEIQEISKKLEGWSTSLVYKHLS